MLKTHLKIAYRNLIKHRFYTTINVFGLSLAIGCCIVLFKFITYHLSFDTYHHNAKQLYKVVYELHIPDGSLVYEKGAPMVMAKAIASQVPQIKNTALLLKDRSFTVAVDADSAGTNQLFAEQENIALADRHWFELFDYNWVGGSRLTALNEPNTVVVTQKLARKYFGDLNAIGKVITIENRLRVKITGILADIPPNSSIQTEMFISLSSFNQLNPDFAKEMQTDWLFINSHTDLYVQLNHNVSAQAGEKAVMNVFNKSTNYTHKEFDYKLLPLKEVHFDSRYGGVIQKSLLVTLGFVGLLLILIACVNFINMATAQNTKRAKEIGTRKVLGSSPSGIFYQFMSETSVIILLAVLLAVIFAAIGMPILNRWLGTAFSLSLGYKLPVYLIILFLIITFAAGFYPAVVLSRFKPINALKNKINNHINASQFTRKSLIVVQNIIAQVLIICTILITLQTNFLKSADPGFDKNAIVVMPVPDNVKYKTDYLRNSVLNYPDIKSISYCYSPAISSASKGGSIKYNNRDWELFSVYTLMGDVNYVKTFGLKIIAGKNLNESNTAVQFLVNEKLVQKLGVKNAEEVIGRKLTCGDLNNSEGIIVGVVKDFHARSLYEAIQPELITTSRENYRFAAVKLTGKNMPDALEHIKASWKSVYPANAFEYQFLDNEIAKFYSKEELLGKLIKASTLVAICISCIGLLGLISLITSQRIKEIGIRKVLGASIADITTLISKDLLKLVCLAILIAIPAAWVLMHYWLQNFAYHISVPLWVFGVTAALSVVISAVTTGIQAVKAAMANPVKSLRTE